MTDNELIEQAAFLPLTYCDNFGGFRKVNGLIRLVGFVFQGGVTLNLACSVGGAEVGHRETARILHEVESVKSLHFWRGHEMAH